MSATNTAAVSTKKKTTFTTKRLVMMAMFAALLCISAYISISLPLPGNPHITMLNFVIIVIALTFSPLEAFTTIMVWMLLGIIGLPVFIGGGASIAYLMTPYAGYTVVFPFMGLLLPLIRGQKYSRLRCTIASVVGVLLIDLIGTFWLMAASHLSLGAGIAAGFLPFLPLDLVKAVVAAQLVPSLGKLLRE